MSSLVTFSDRCYDAFIEPYKQGAYNLRDACSGTKTERAAHSALHPAAAEPAPALSLAERVSAFVIGSLLIVPIVNMVVLAILRNVESNFLYNYNKDLSTFQHPRTLREITFAGNDPENPAPNPPPADHIVDNIAPNPPASNNPENPDQNPPADHIPNNMAPNPPVNIPAPGFIVNNPVDENLEERVLQERKHNALNRLAEIEGMTAGIADDQQQMQALIGRFQCHRDITELNVGRILARYQTYEHPNGLFRFLNWANVPNQPDYNDEDPDRANVQARFREAIGDNIRYYTDNPNNERYRAIYNLFRHLLAYFNQHRNRVAPGSAEEEALQVQFQNVCLAIADANEDCVDQMLSQMQNLVLNIFVQAETGVRELTPEQKLLNQVRLALSWYKINLIKNVVREQNEDIEHAADVEQMTVRILADELGLRGNIFELGAQFEQPQDNGRQRAEHAAATVRQRYNPLEYLFTGLRASIEGDELSGAFRTMFQWASEHYNLGDENPDHNPQPHDMDQRLSDDFDEMPFSMAGGLTIPATALLMEAAGLIVAR